jgi:hypothetical protein
MTKIKNLEINVHSFRTTYSYTGKLISESLEQQLLPVKKKLIRDALSKFKTITACGPLCFQIYDQKLFFYFNFNETTKALSESLTARSLVFSL